MMVIIVVREKESIIEKASAYGTFIYRNKRSEEEKGEEEQVDYSFTD